MQWLYILCCAFLVAGCEVPAEHSTLSDAERAQTAFQPATVFLRPYGHATDDGALFRAHLEALAEVGPLLESTEVPTSDALRAFTDFLARHRGSAHHALLEQTIAYKVLETVYPVSNGTFEDTSSRRALTAEEQDAVGFATRLLVANDNPNADLIVAALGGLRGHWSEQAIKDHAAHAQESARTWLAELGCSDCLAGVQKAYPEFATNREAAIFEATHELSALAH